MNLKNPRYITLEIQVLAWDKHNNVAECKPVGQWDHNTPPLDNWMTNGKIEIKKTQNKTKKPPKTNKKTCTMLQTITLQNVSNHLTYQAVFHEDLLVNLLGVVILSINQDFH
jgi:hypothetical protein